MTGLAIDAPPAAPVLEPVAGSGTQPGSAAAMLSRVHTGGLALRASARWPEPGDPAQPPALAGFVVSSFSPLIAAVAERCLVNRFGQPGAAGAERAGAARTAIVIVTALGDVSSAVHVADAVDRGARIGPLLFYQSVPNAIAGYLAARWGLAGPVVCTSPIADELTEGLAVTALLIEDGDCDEALIVVVWPAESGAEAPDAATALVVAAPPIVAAPPGPGPIVAAPRMPGERGASNASNSGNAGPSGE